jgi:hypothetical protein
MNLYYLALSLVNAHHRPISTLPAMLQLLREHRPTVKRVLPCLQSLQWRIPYPGMPCALSLCSLTKCYIGLSHEWRHVNRLWAKHLRDKLNKCLKLFFTVGAAPALMSDLIEIWEQHGEKSVLTGCVQDMSDSSQNNKRAAEMASFKVAHALLDHTPSALGTAMHAGVATLAEGHLSAFVDAPHEAPACPTNRIARPAFVHSVLLYNTIAVCKGHELGMREYVRTINKHGYTAPTR